MVFAPCIGYVSQIQTMQSTGQAEAFSTYVSFILIFSNTVRLFWWFAERFSVVLLWAAIVMIICQLVLIYVWVQVVNQPDRALHEFLQGRAGGGHSTVERFWNWRNFNSYLKALGVMLAVLLFLTTLAHN